jgi:hypothetical protein
MYVEFNVIGLSLSGQVYVKEARPFCKFAGHPDSWEEGEPEEVKIESLECGDRDAMFLLDADFGGELEDAAYKAATSGKRQAA